MILQLRLHKLNLSFRLAELAQWSKVLIYHCLAMGAKHAKRTKPPIRTYAEPVYAEMNQNVSEDEENGRAYPETGPIYAQPSKTGSRKLRPYRGLGELAYSFMVKKSFDVRSKLIY